MRKRNGQIKDIHSEMEEAESKIKILKDIVVSLENDEDKIYSMLQVETDKLQLKINKSSDM